MKRFVAVLIVVVALCAWSSVAMAEGEDPAVDRQITVVDVIAVSEQLKGMEKEIDMLARLVYAEGRGVPGMQEKAAIIWCALNRADVGLRGDCVCDVVKARSQFAYRPKTKLEPALQDLARDVLARWLLEKRGITDVGRVLPKEYLYFAGRHGHNFFRTGYKTHDYWDWSMPDPYLFDGIRGAW